jgi:hypothetical protein
VPIGGATLTPLRNTMQNAKKTPDVGPMQEATQLQTKQ